MKFSGLGTWGRTATYLAAFFSPPYKGREYLSRMNKKGFISPSASIRHNNLFLGDYIFIGDRVVIHEAKEGGSVKIGKGTHIHLDCIIETGSSGSLIIGEHTHIQPRCQFSSYKGRVVIGNGVQIAPNCSFYPYMHGIVAGKPIKKQPLQTKGGILIDDDALLSVGVIVLDGVRIGKGAVIGAGSVVTTNIPDNAVAVGVPARVIKIRNKDAEKITFQYR